jgi:hypothetical protein
MATKGPEYLITRDLRAMGWTDGRIRSFLPEPDATRANPYYQSAAPVKLYSARRVRRIEATKTFRVAREKAEGRKAGAAKAVATKREWMDRHVEEIEIAVPVLPRDELIRRACANYNSLARSERTDSYASPSSDPEFLARICVNYLRHCLTDYERELALIRGLVATAEGYTRIKERVLDAIAERYDWLADECDEQILRADTRA